MTNMLVRNYTAPGVFLERARPLLEARESANNLILGIATRLYEHPEWTEADPFLATVEDEDQSISLVAIITPPYNILLAGVRDISEEDRAEAISALIDNLRHGGWPVPGVNAEARLSEQFAKAWSGVTGQSYRRKMRLRAYELRQVIQPANPPPGSFRQAGESDLETIASWHQAFNHEALGKEIDADQARSHTARRIETGDIFVWEDGEIVTTCMRSRPTRNGYTVTGVYTPPDKRGRGYASACVAALSQLILDSGKQFCNLFTDLDYPTSNSIYQKVGYFPIYDFTEHRFDAGK